VASIPERILYRSLKSLPSCSALRFKVDMAPSLYSSL
jgi:hypothetical protein